ncbi:PREDICTED: olfactory receptor 1013-like, partial [Galeopterus variegatus]|uniref:Olfactory receptor 1013-like n=1 Tax=Galeopterus variegatus TaxID=482537 RepID=A0ABM0Q287_GALVR
MAYDRYVAISNPLLYAQAMSRRLCICLVVHSYTGGFVNAVILTSNTFTLDFCGDNVIDDFFCDVPPLVKLACDVKDSYQAVLYFLLASNVITPALLILASYLFIIAAVLQIHSTQGRLKAFSTCSSHLISVTLYYGSILYIYSRPSSSYSLERDKVVSTFYTVLFPMLNPMIYSLRNKDVKEALKKIFKLAQSEGIASAWSGVNKENCTIVQGDSCQVRPTSGEGLEAALGGADLQDGDNDEEVGGKDKSGGSDDIG